MPDDPDRFLVLPFSAGTRYAITETWEYSPEERAIHGFGTHYALDVSAERGTPVYAPADGYAFSSFHLGFAGPTNGSFTYRSAEARTYDGRYVGYGLGNFVQIYVPERDAYIKIAHLQQVAPTLPFHMPRQIDDGWYPDILSKAVGDTVIHTPAVACRVKRGDLIGYVGDTGCSWGYLERPNEPRPNPKQFPSWDETHVHLEVCRRDSDGKMVERFDPLQLLVFPLQ